VPEVWIEKRVGRRGEGRYLVKVSNGRSVRAYTATEVVVDDARVGEVKELHVSAEEVRVVEEGGEIAVFIVSRSQALAEKLTLMLAETPIRISA